jgi:autotransporter-associated beta strand protein
MGEKTKIRSRIACLSAAVAVFMYGGAGARATDLTWDSDPVTPAVQDGDGNWNLTSANWFDGVNNVTWTNSPPDSAFFGNATNVFSGAATPHNIDFADPSVMTPPALTVQNLVLGVAADGATYNFSDFGGGSLTIAGSVTKTAPGGTLQFLLSSGPLTLAAGDNSVALADSPGDVAELSVNGTLAGSGNLILDNTSTYDAFGTLVLNGANTYTGATTITKGRIVITTASGLGATSAGTSIGEFGTLGIGGAQTTVVGPLDIAEPITITRSLYSEAGGDYGRYDGAIRNDSGDNTLSGPLTLNTSEARFQINGGSLTIPTNLTDGTTSVKISKSGGAVLFLTGTANTYTGGTAMRGGTVAITSDANIGGPTSQLFFDGGYLRVPDSWTDFGAHVVDFGAWAGGVDTPGVSQVFVINQNLTGTNFNKRGVGTVNLNGTNVFNNDNFTDLGTVNISGSTTARSIRIRNGTVVVNSGGTYTTTGSFTSIGIVAGETGTLIVKGTGSVIAANQDFNVSDNANSAGFLTVQDNATLTVAGQFFVAKNNPTSGTMTISDSATVNANKTGQNSLNLGQGTGAVGMLTQSGGTLNVAGEFWVGNNTGGTGLFNHSGGAMNAHDWFVVGRFGAAGALDLSGGTITKDGGGNTEWDVQGGASSTVLIRGTGVYTATTGDVRVGQGGGASCTLLVKDSGSLVVSAGQMWVGNDGGRGIATLQDSASVTVSNNWLAVGRNSGSNGILNLTGNATLTKNGPFDRRLLLGQAGGNGTLNQTGGTLTNTSETWICDGGTGLYDISGGVANVGLVVVGQSGAVTTSATLTVRGTGEFNATSVRLAATGQVKGTINLDGGRLTATEVVSGGAGTGTKTFNFNGGTLRAGANSGAFMQGLTVANVKDGGAVIDTNGFNVTIAQPLIANGTGGLSKIGSGTLTLTGTANTWTGPTSVTGGTLVLASSLTTSSAVNVNGATLQLASDGSSTRVIRTPNVTVSAGTIDLTDNKLITATPVGTASGGVYNGVTGLIQSGRNGGGWGGNGIVTSQTAATTGNFTSIGIATAAQAKLIGATDTAVWGGQTVTGTDTLVMYTYGGDANLDGKINVDDYGRIDSNIGLGTAGWYNGDFNYDGKVNVDDYGVIDSNIGIQGAPFPTAAGLGASTLAGVSAVPEPASIAILGLSAVALLGGRRRRGRRRDII